MGNPPQYLVSVFTPAAPPPRSSQTILGLRYPEIFVAVGIQLAGARSQRVGFLIPGPQGQNAMRFERHLAQVAGKALIS